MDFLLIVFYLIFFYLLFLIQTIIIFNTIFSYLILVILFLIILFENPNKKNSFLISAFVGFMWGFFSLKPIILYVLIFTFINFLLKYFFKNHVRFYFK